MCDVKAAVLLGGKNHLVSLVTFISDSSAIVQFSMSPLTNPEMMTNRRTSTLTEVKTLLTDADSFTPNDKSPVRGKQKSLTYRQA